MLEQLHKLHTSYLFLPAKVGFYKEIGKFLLGNFLCFLYPQESIKKSL